jgi:hypothetical protein
MHRFVVDKMKIDIDLDMNRINLTDHNGTKLTIDYMQEIVTVKPDRETIIREEFYPDLETRIKKSTEKLVCNKYMQEGGTKEEMALLVEHDLDSYYGLTKKTHYTKNYSLIGKIKDNEANIRRWHERAVDKMIKERSYKRTQIKFTDKVSYSCGYGEGKPLEHSILDAIICLFSDVYEAGNFNNLETDEDIDCMCEEYDIHGYKELIHIIESYREIINLLETIEPESLEYLHELNMNGIHDYNEFKESK